MTTKDYADLAKLCHKLLTDPDTYIGVTRGAMQVESWCETMLIVPPPPDRAADWQARMRATVERTKEARLGQASPRRKPR